MPKHSDSYEAQTSDPRSQVEYSCIKFKGVNFLYLNQNMSKFWLSYSLFG